MTTIAVAGAGVFGAWTALRLAQAGHQVTLIEAFGPANGRASSADHSRVIRAGYGADAIYSRWAADSRRDWQWLESQTGVAVFRQTGALFMGKPDEPYIQQTFETLRTLDHAIERLETADVARRFPQVSVTGLGDAVLEHAAGVLRARLGVQAAVRLAIERFGVVYRTARIDVLDEQQPSPLVRTRDGDAIAADIYMFACGPWLPRLLPHAVGARIRPTRQEILYFGVPGGDDRYSLDRLPVWIDFVAGLYGIPDFDAHGFKVGIDRHGPSIDPDTDDRLVDRTIVESTRAWIGTRFPGLRDAPLVDARVCQYENTCTGDFIIDRHPAWPNVWIAGGGSGHGFKHGPAVARYLVDRIAGTGQPDDRFSLARKTAAAERQVY